MGCNMPLFTFTFGPDRIVPITQARTPTEHPAFPGIGLPPNVKAKARWLNYYSRNDLLGFSAEALNGAYAGEKRISDIAVVSEGRWKKLLLLAVSSGCNICRAHRLLDTPPVHPRQRLSF